MILSKHSVCSLSICFLFSATLTSFSSAQRREFILPIIVNGKVGEDRFFQSRIHFVTPSLPEAVCLDGFNNEGGPINVACLLSRMPSICVGQPQPELGTPAYLVQAQCLQQSPPLDEGWISVSFLGAGKVGISAELLLRQTGTLVLLDPVSVPAVEPAQQFVTAAVFEKALALDRATSAFAIVNPSATQNANVIFKVGKEDRPECSSTMVIPPKNRITKFLDEIVPQCSKTSSVLITADIPIAVGALKISLPEFKLGNLPVVAIDN